MLGSKIPSLEDSMKICRSSQFSALAVLLCTSGAWAQSSAARVEMVSRPVEVRPLAPGTTQRFSALHTSLRPSANAWVEQQARVEAKRPAPDLAGLRSQIRSRFTASLASPKPANGQVSGMTSLPAGADIEAMVFIVLMQAANDMDQDLQQIMAQVKAETAAKQKLRDLQNQLNHEVASANGNMIKQPCRTAACAALPGELTQLAAATAQTRHPIRLTSPANASYGQIQQLVTQTNNQLDSLGDMSEQDQLQLQMLMDRRSKVEEAISNMMKSQQDTASSIVSNLK
jgi:hypothetical protein